MNSRFKTPGLDELSLFFQSDPLEIFPDDATYTFRHVQGDTVLLFTCNESQAFIKTILQDSPQARMDVSFEGCENIQLLGDRIGRYLIASFRMGNASIQLKIRLSPEINVVWSGLAQ